MFKAIVDVTLKKSVLDPQGKTVLEALHALGYKNVPEVRIGKHFELSLDYKDEQKAKADVEMMCKELLINPVIEAYTYQIERV